MINVTNFNLIWEIDNATARFATGKVESGVFDKGGFKWTAAVERSGAHSATVFTLRCDTEHDGPWKCLVMCRLFVETRRDGSDLWSEDMEFCFNEREGRASSPCSQDWENFDLPLYNYDDKVRILVIVFFMRSERGEPIAKPFSAPDDESDVVLVIGDEKLHVSKMMLSFHSPVFKAMFFGDFAEKDKEEVELKDEFINVLLLLNMDVMVITDRTVLHILKLADRFQIKRLVSLSEKHLMHTPGVDMMKKLLLADQYRLASLKDHCLKSFTTVSEVAQKIKSFSESIDFSTKMKLTLFDLQCSLPK